MESHSTGTPSYQTKVATADNEAYSDETPDTHILIQVYHPMGVPLVIRVRLV